MMELETLIEQVASQLPAAYVRHVNAQIEDPEERYGPDDEIPDIEVMVEFTPGWYTPATFHDPAEGEDPEVLSVNLTMPDGKEIDIQQQLSSVEMRRIIDACWEEQRRSAREDFYEPCGYDDEPYDDPSHDYIY